MESQNPAPDEQICNICSKRLPELTMRLHEFRCAKQQAELNTS